MNWEKIIDEFLEQGRIILAVLLFVLLYMNGFLQSEELAVAFLAYLAGIITPLGYLIGKKK